VRVGLAPGPPLNFKVRPFSGGGGPLEDLFPYLRKASQHNASWIMSSRLSVGRGRFPLSAPTATRQCKLRAAPRVYTTVKINTRTDKDQTLEDKVASVQALL